MIFNFEENIVDLGGPHTRTARDLIGYEVLRWGAPEEIFKKLTLFCAFLEQIRFHFHVFMRIKGDYAVHLGRNFAEQVGPFFNLERGPTGQLPGSSNGQHAPA